jgi:hypothetical protein
MARFPSEHRDNEAPWVFEGRLLAGAWPKVIAVVDGEAAAGDGVAADVRAWRGRGITSPS